MNRAILLLVTALSISVLVAPTCFNLAPRLLWNATASVPVGLYTLHDAGQLQIGDLVALQSPEAISRLMVERGYIATGIPVLKRIAALSGQTICRENQLILIDGEVAANALSHDSKGRPLPVWTGCKVLSADEIFAMNADIPDSFDGRYFGVIATSNVIAIAHPVFIPPTSSSQQGDFR